MRTATAGGCRVLLLVADPDVSAACARALREEGLEVLAGRLGEDPVAVALENDVDAALVETPAGTPPERSPRRILRTTPATRSLPLVALVRRRALAAWPEHADDCLAQPFHVEELRVRMRTAAALGRALKRLRRAQDRRAGALDAAPGGAAGDRPREPALQPGARLAGCRMLAPLGGARRDVYLAEHEVLGVRVCVKLFPVAVGQWSPDQLERFIRGARAAARLEHPNIVPVLNAGREGAFYFVVRRYVEGTPLDRLAARGDPMAEARVRRIARDVAEALAEAHRRHIVHRDVKPANIILTEEGAARLIDFGLARPLDAPAISSSGAVVGTPHYMPPEQCDGDLLDARADVYALGATLYHLLAGRPPFTGRTLMELLRKQLYEEPTPLREVRPKVSEPLAAVVHRMMAKAKEERYPSGAGVLEALASLPPVE